MREADVWILSRCHRTIGEVNAFLDRYQFNAALDAIYHFAWNDLCDWYVEYSKTGLNPPVFSEVFLDLIKLLHPFMPFITEELYSVLQKSGAEERLIVSPWPVCDESRLDENAEKRMAFIQSVVSAIRNLRAEKNIPPSKKGDVLILCENPEMRNWLQGMDTAIRQLSRTETLKVLPEGAPPGNAASAVAAGVKIFLNLEGMIDKAAEREKIGKEIEKSEGFLMSVQKKLKNEGFLKSAPPEVVEKEKTKMKDTLDKIEKLKENLKTL
jgi:valyl-tRNA synthetase